MTLLLVQKDPRLGKCFTKKTTQKTCQGSDMDLTKFHHFNYLLLAPLFVFMYWSTDIVACGLWGGGCGGTVCGKAYGEIGPGLSL